MVGQVCTWWGRCACAAGVYMVEAGVSRCVHVGQVCMCSRCVHGGAGVHVQQVCTWWGRCVHGAAGVYVQQVCHMVGQVLNSVEQSDVKMVEQVCMCCRCVHGGAGVYVQQVCRSISATWTPVKLFGTRAD